MFVAWFTHTRTQENRNYLCVTRLYIFAKLLKNKTIIYLRLFHVWRVNVLQKSVGYLKWLKSCVLFTCPVLVVERSIKNGISSKGKGERHLSFIAKIQNIIILSVWLYYTYYCPNDISLHARVLHLWLQWYVRLICTG